MVIYPLGKINIGLYVCKKRSDGYHDIISLFFPLRLCDILEFITISDGSAANDELSLSGLSVPGRLSDNLIIKACNIIRENCSLPFFRIHLHKIIPAGAGLGGGSSDCAAFIGGIKKYTRPMLTDAATGEIALSLGSDCPFFLNPSPGFAYGRGEILKPANISLNGYWLSIFNPGIHVSTAEAYRHAEIGLPGLSLEEAVNLPVETWKDNIRNVFEKPVFKMHPAIRILKEELYREGAVYASMSGSGSSVYGLFLKKPSWNGMMGKAHIWTEQI